MPTPTATRLAPAAASDATGTPGAGVAAPEDLLARLLAQGIVEGVATRLLATRGPAVVKRSWRTTPTVRGRSTPPAPWCRRSREDWERRPAGSTRRHRRGPPPGERRRSTPGRGAEERIEGRWDSGCWASGAAGSRRRRRSPSSARGSSRVWRTQDRPPAPGEAPIPSGEGPGQQTDRRSVLIGNNRGGFTAWGGRFVIIGVARGEGVPSAPLAIIGMPMGHCHQRIIVCKRGSRRRVGRLVRCGLVVVDTVGEFDEASSGVGRGGVG